MPDATYERIAADLRQQIQDGRYQPGARLPSLADIEAQYDVSHSTSRKVFEVLLSEGLIVARKGYGYSVRRAPQIHERTPPGLVRDSTRGWYIRRTRSPFAAETRAAGRVASWDWKGHVVPASANVAERLQIEPGDAVMESSYTFRADGEPTYRSLSWEPHELTRGTPIEFPEKGAAYGMGVLDRMESIGVVLHHVTEKLFARRAGPEDVERLGVTLGDPMLCMERTYYDIDGRPVETADVSYPQGWRAVYELRVRDAD